MIGILRETLTQLAASKKAWAAVLSVVASLLAWPLVRLVGVPDDKAADLAMVLAGVIGTVTLGYLHGQGKADEGKEAAKIVAATEEMIATERKPINGAGK